MTPRLFEFLAALLYLIPIAVVLVARAERSRPLSAIALDIPFAVALDLLGLFALSRVLTLDVAALVSRGIWIAGGLLVLLRRRREGAQRPAWPRSLSRREALVALGAAALALSVSIPLSRHYLIHDRTWHGPLVTSLGGQRLPFRNVLGHEVLRYHVIGDVLAAELRALSFDVLSSHHALGLAHDLLFAIAAATTALLVRAFGMRLRWPAILGGVALLTSGPIPLRGPTGARFMGFSYHLLLSLSFRPHVALAALLLIGFIGAIAARMRADARGFPPSFAIEVTTFAVLAITDETSAALVGVSLFLMCVLARRTVRTFLGLGALALGAAATSLAFGGSLAPGGPVGTLTWAPSAIVPAIVGASLPLASAAGSRAFFFDVLPFAACAIGLFLGALRVRSLRGPSLFALALTSLALLLGTHLIVNHDSAEAQRFFFAPFFCAPLLGLLHLPRLGRRSVARMAVLLGVFVPAMFNVYWLIERAPIDLRFAAIGKQPWFDDVLQTDCRRVAGARIGEAPRLTYVDSSMFVYFSGCRPIFAPGRSVSPWPTKVAPIFESPQELSELNRDPTLGDQSLDAICSATDTPDPICSALRRKPELCRPEGSAFIRCAMSAATRAALLRPRHP